MVKKIDAESVAREDMPSYKDRSLMSQLKKYIDDSHDPKKLPEMMRRKTAAETDAGKGEGILQKLRSPYQSGADTEYNKRNSAVQKKAEDEYKNTKSDMAASALGIKSKPSVKVDTRDMDYGNRPNDVPDAVIKKTEIIKTAPVVSRKSAPSIMKSKGHTEGDRVRAAIESMRGQYESGDLYNKAGLEKSAEDENAYTKSVAGEESKYKKGGMTKRPPKPAKKVPARKFASGGSTSRTSASKRGDGCATKGHTRGKYC
jgi:hypothetical protein